MPRILRRVWSNLWGRRQPLISLVGNLSYRRNFQLNYEAYAAFQRYLGNKQDRVKKLPKKMAPGVLKTITSGKRAGNRINTDRVMPTLCDKTNIDSNIGYLEST
jgi:hypothetical protein